MSRLSMRSIFTIAALPVVGLVEPLSAQPQPSQPQPSQPLPDRKSRCAQLIAYYDRYGSGRNAHSDGVRNMTRIGASIDCSKGYYEEGISSMKALLIRKKFAVPPPPPQK